MYRPTFVEVGEMPSTSSFVPPAPAPAAETVPAAVERLRPNVLPARLEEPLDEIVSGDCPPLLDEDAADADFEFAPDELPGVEPELLEELALDDDPPDPPPSTDVISFLPLLMLKVGIAHSLATPGKSPTSSKQET